MSTSRNLLDFYQVVKRHDVCPPSKRRKVFVEDTKVAATSLSLSHKSSASIKGLTSASVDVRKKSSDCCSAAALKSSRSIEESKTLEAVELVSCVKSHKRKLGTVTDVEDSRVNVEHLSDSVNNNKHQITEIAEPIISAKMPKMDIASQLAKSGKIKELKETLMKLKNAKDKLKAVESVSTTSNQRSSTDGNLTIKTALAWQRFHSLAESDAASQLALPYKYKFLAEVFQCTDTVAGIMHNRQEVCSFKKLKPAVQEMVHRTFEVNHLAQIKTVFPSAYIFRQEKVATRRDCFPVTESQLTVTINTDCVLEEKNNLGSSESSKNAANKCNSGFVPVDPGFLLSRRKMFRHRLIEILKKHHAEFLSKLNPPIKVMSNQITRWHPLFPLENLPEMPPDQLPEPESSQKCMTAKDVLNKIKGLYSSKLDKALESVAKNSATTVTENVPAPSDLEKSLEKNSKLKGIPPHLLAKIRAKEAEKIKAEMTRDPITERRKVMLARLPEIVRILRNFFISEKKAAIPIGVAVNKVSESYAGSLMMSEMQSHLMLLTELVPNWLSCVKVKSALFLKMNKQADVNSIVDFLVQTEKKVI